MLDIFTYFLYLVLLIVLIMLTYQASLTMGITEYLFEEIKLKKSFVFGLLALLLISFIVGNRYHVGNDWEGYVANFEYLKSNKFITFRDWHTEWGFYIINRIVADIGFNYTLMFFIMAIISWFFYFKSVPAALLPLLLYFTFTNELFFWSMNGIRQFAAIGILYYSLRFIQSRNFKKFIFFILIGSLFHISIILMIPIYFIPYQKLYNQKFWIIAFLISLLFMRSSMNFILSRLNESLVEKIPIISIYFQRYLSSGILTGNESNLGLGFVYGLFISFLIILFSKSVIKKHPDTKMYFILYFLGTIIFNLFFQFQLINRINDYLLFLKPIVLSFVIFYLWNKKKYRPIFVGVMVIYFFVFLVTIYKSADMCSPYQFAFFH